MPRPYLIQNTAIMVQLIKHANAQHKELNINAYDNEHALTALQISDALYEPCLSTEVFLLKEQYLCWVVLNSTDLTMVDRLAVASVHRL